MRNKLKSHPDKLLIDHLSEVAVISKSLIEGKNFCISFQFEDKKTNINALIPELAFLAGAFHDLGKATTFFQDYINKPEGIHDRRKNHALPSAIFVCYIADRYLCDKEINPLLKQLLSIFTFSAVKKHHGKLINLSDEILISDDLQDLLIEQIQNIDSQEIFAIINKLTKRFEFTVNWKDFVDFVKKKKYVDLFVDFSFDVLNEQYKKINEQSRLVLFYVHQLIYSALLFADKNDVIIQNFENTIEQTDILNKISEFRERKKYNQPKTEINKLKNKAFFESLSNLETVFNKKQHIYSVTLPTGIGKTITAYNLADKIRKLAGFPDSKIIINIPFTSIIDQNFEVYADILESKNTNILLKHHHLADPVYKTNENIANYNESRFLIETWQSDTVVTTFVQLLETLLSCDKTKLMKFANLANSVILLDEIQTIPYHYWETIRESFKILGEKFNIYFVLISATQPLIFIPEEDIKELIPCYKSYFQFFNRTKLVINKEKVSFDYFKDNIVEYINSNPNKDILTIVNTKKAALETFQFVCNTTDKEKVDVYFLTTLITPYERKRIIKKIKQKSDKQKIIISTQLVEAGVDISINTVFRQIAPLDSIIQAAGRANRYYENKEISEIFLFDIDELRKVSNKIYGNDLLIKTENVLKKFQEIEEKDYLQLIESYFTEVRKQSDQTTNKLLKAMQDLNFSLVDFELIENRKSESVFIQINPDAKEIWNRYVEIYSKENIKHWEQQELFSQIKTDFYDYVINVPIPWGEESITFDSEKKYNFYVKEYGKESKFYSFDKENYRKNIGYHSSENSALCF